ncbi:MAG: radical SAM protein, partial [Duodenibacillus sp.]|nr:radical SAM protein [Duodenibacillus sp.]
MATVLYPGPVFGPVTSRRLGRSLGVNLLPPDGKVCDFDCVYCECGLNAERRPRLPMPSRAEVARALEARLLAARGAGEAFDAVTFAGNGEPTGHPEFAGVIDDALALRDRLMPQARVCVLTNATHLAKDAVFATLSKVDRPCLKLDTADAAYIRRVNRPACRYDVAEVIARMRRLGGRAIVQTMFMKGAWEGESVDNTGEAYL